MCTGILKGIQKEIHTDIHTYLHSNMRTNISTVLRTDMSINLSKDIYTHIRTTVSIDNRDRELEGPLPKIGPFLPFFDNVTLYILPFSGPKGPK